MKRKLPEEPSALRAKNRLHAVLHWDRKQDPTVQDPTVQGATDYESDGLQYNVTIIDRYSKRKSAVAP
jgi:hypothetical protein